MKFDSNRAWGEATAAISANREVLLALAGVFFMLPSLAFSLFLPPPEPPAGMMPEQMMALMQDYYLSVLPWAIPMAVLQTLGSLAILTLFTDRTRPTVGMAIKQGLAGVLPYLGANLLIGLGFGLGGGLLIALARASGIGALMALVIIALVGAGIYVMLRTLLVAPAVAVDGIRSPIAALNRSWMLTRGNAGRIALFFALLLVAFIVVSIVLNTIVGALLALLLGDAAKVAVAIVSAALGAAFSLYAMAAIASVHRQLSGSTGTTFD